VLDDEKIGTDIRLQRRGHRADMVVTERALLDRVRSDVSGMRRPGEDTFDRLSRSSSDTLDMERVQTRVIAFDDRDRYRIEGTGQLERDDERLENFCQIQVTAGSLRDLEYELRAGLNCVPHKQEYHGLASVRLILQGSAALIMQARCYTPPTGTITDNSKRRLLGR
jgi:hypothetical protein